MSKLVGNTNAKVAGDFVRNHQEMASDDGFSAVSRLWYEQTKPLDWGMEQLQTYAEQHEDLKVKAKELDFNVNDNNEFVVKHIPTDRYFAPTPFALKKLASWARCSTTIDQYTKPELHPVSKKVVYERDRKDKELIVAIINNGFRDNRVNPDKDFLLRVNKKKNTLRTILSSEYKPVDNLWVFEIWSKLLPGARLSHWLGDEDNLYGNLLIPDTLREESDSDYGGMISVGNSQIGTHRIRNVPSIFRSICMNGCIWGQVTGEGINQVHKGKKVDLNELAKAIESNITEQIPLLPQGIDKILKLRSLTWDSSAMTSKPIYAVMAKEFGFDKAQATRALEGYRTEVAESDVSRGTLFGVVNGITRAAHHFDAQQRIRMETIAGNLISYDKDDWSMLTNRAKHAKTKFVDAAFLSEVA